MNAADWDKSHFSLEVARMITGLIADGVVAKDVPGLAEFLVNDDIDVSPTTVDNPEDTLAVTEKPDDESVLVWLVLSG